MAKARTFRGRGRSRKVMMAKTANARAAIGDLAPGGSVYILTFGQFSLMDAICEVLRQTGPADVVISTWTAAHADLRRTEQQVRTAGIRSMRWVVDRSFVSRQPGYCALMRELFGDECIRTTRTHCKFTLIGNERWTIVLRTSMNLNENPRLENLEIDDDPTLHGFLLGIVDELFDEQESGVLNGELPALSATQDSGCAQITMGVVSTGTARIG